MESTVETINDGINSSVGSLVWVRRRNGSWWPARIVDPKELSESCLVSPKAGTPVRLLGRPGASVDWYNLEKSIRVKPFRCEEFAVCVEKAKLSAANSSKRVAKYARREDAILEALEIEKEQLGENGPGGTDNSCSEDGGLCMEVPSLSNSSRGIKYKAISRSNSAGEPNSAPELSEPGHYLNSSDDISVLKVPSEQLKRKRNPKFSEEDGNEGIKRMRGFKDLGICLGSKENVHAGVVLENVRQDSALLTYSHATSCVANETHVNGNKGSSSLPKRKQSRVATINDIVEKLACPKQLTEVLENSVNMSVPVISDQHASSNGSPVCGFSDSKVPGLESDDSRKSTPVFVNLSSDSSGGSGKNCLSVNASSRAWDGADDKVQYNGVPSIAELANSDSFQGLFDVPFHKEDKNSSGNSAVFTTQLVERSHGRVSKSLSRQAGQHKAVSLKSDGPKEADNSSQLVERSHGRVYRRLSRQASQDKAVSLKSDGPNEAANSSQLIAVGVLNWQFKKRRNLRAVNRNRNQNSGIWPITDNNILSARLMSSWGTNSRGPKAIAHPDITLSTQRTFRNRCPAHFNGKSVDKTMTLHARSPLYDVNVEVEASYEANHDVPLLSLMSRGNGTAIVGHPLEVEVLADSHSGLLLTAKKYHATVDADNPSSAPKQNRRRRKKHVNWQPRRKSKKSSASSLKVRKLSSLTGQRRNASARDKILIENTPQKAVVACIPVKLAFSRISEALNGSARP